MSSSTTLSESEPRDPNASLVIFSYFSYFFSQIEQIKVLLKTELDPMKKDIGEMKKEIGETKKHVAELRISAENKYSLFFKINESKVKLD
jgi:hypothetical protein